MICSATVIGRIIETCFLLNLMLSVTPLYAQGVMKGQATPSAVIRESFEALKRRDFQTTVSLFHPDETRKFKAFAIDIFKHERPDEEILLIRRMLAPFNSAESVALASGSDLLSAFLKNSLSTISGFDELMANAKLEIMGEIEETPDKVYVISRTITPRPQPASCRKLDGRWYQLFDDSVMRVITAFEQKEHFRKKIPEIEDVFRKSSINAIEAIGYVKDGDDTAQVLCRFVTRIEDFDIPMIKCYPVRKGEPAWSHLNDKDKSKLVEALRSKWGL